ncbi:MAG TPA: hypothetical protein DCX77_03155 [Acidimicrobiaceae bacterium]|nr:hypothetical protein [Acidimicrobiaceae bacterium]
MESRNERLIRPMFLVALTVTIVAALSIQARATYNAQVTADEPQYLITALSLGEDFDLDISDELEDGKFRDFHEVNLNPQTIALDDTGLKISPHDPLLPLLLAIPMKLGGWQLAKAALALIAGITAAATLWLAVRRFNVGTRTAIGVVTALFCASPLTSYGSQVYPAMPAALCVVLGVAGVTSTSSRAWSWTAVAMMVCLPWLGIKYVPLAAVLAIFLIWGKKSLHDLTLNLQLLALVISGLVYLVVHHRIYGSWTVYATGDHFVNSEWIVVGSSPDYAGRTRRLLGLIVDRRFGIAAWTPAYLAIPFVITRMVRRKDDHWQLMITLCAVCWGIATWIALTMHGWWWSGRQIVPILPLIVVLLAVAVDKHRRAFQAVILTSFIGIFSWLWLVYETSTSKHTLIVDFERTTNPWYRFWRLLLPDHQIMSTTDHVLTGVWTVVLAFGCWSIWTRWSPKTKSQSAINIDDSDETR